MDFEKHLKDLKASPEMQSRHKDLSDMRNSAKATLWAKGAIALDETNVVRALRFACTGCGKCCDTPPGMNLLEALRLADRFVLKVELRSVGKMDPTNPFDQHHLDMTYPELDLDADEGRRERFSENLTAQAKTLGLPFTKTEGPASDLAVRIMFTDLMDETGACPMRKEDGFCSIYGDRPAKCRVVPFDETIPLEDAGDAATFSIMHLITVKQGTCQVDAGAPVIWEDGVFADPEIEEAHESVLFATGDDERAASKSVADEVLQFKSKETEIDRSELERYCATREADDPAPMSSMVPVLYRLISEGFISSEQAVGLLEKQIMVIEDRLKNTPKDARPNPVYGVTYAVMLQDWLSLYSEVVAGWKTQKRL